MKLLPLLLILISCGNTAKKQGYFNPLGTSYLCKKITHDNTLKDCYDGTYGFLTSVDTDIINAVNIIKVYR